MADQERYGAGVVTDNTFFTNSEEMDYSLMLKFIV